MMMMTFILELETHLHLEATQLQELDEWIHLHGLYKMTWIKATIVQCSTTTIMMTMTICRNIQATHLEIIQDKQKIAIDKAHPHPGVIAELEGAGGQIWRNLINTSAVVVFQLPVVDTVGIIEAVVGFQATEAISAG